MSAESSRTTQGNANRSAGRKARLDPLVREMYAAYQSGLTLAEVAEKFGRSGKNGQQCVWHLFKVRGLACRKVHSIESYRKTAATRRAELDLCAAAMHADYLALKSVVAVARKWKSDKGTVKYVLQRNGYTVRAIKKVERTANGSPVRYVPLTPAQIDALIAKATRVCLPAELRFEWRSWSLERRGEFIARLRAKLQLSNERPTTTFSAGLEPFDYASPRAHEIARRMNVGRDSRTKLVAIKPSSQGVIYRDQLFFWSKSSGPAYFTGPWRPGTGRPPLHHIIWEEHNGPVPAGYVVRHADGNRNNLDPANLVLATRNDVARENQAGALLRKSRAITALLLARQQLGTSDENTDTVKKLRAG